MNAAARKASAAVLIPHDVKNWKAPRRMWQVQVNPDRIVAALSFAYMLADLMGWLP